jgi:hypothetical protein
VIEAKVPPAKPVETPAPKLQVPESEAAEVKTMEVKKNDEADVQLQEAEHPGDEKGTEEQDETGKKMSDKERVQKLSQKILEQAGIDQCKTASEGKETAKVEASPAAPEEQGEKVSLQTAVVPPGGVPDETKEKKGPVDDIKSWCLDRYQTPSEQDSCMKSRAVAKERTEKLKNEYAQETKEREVFDKCVNDWKDGNTYNYQMIISRTQFYCKQGGIEKCENMIK